MSILPKSSDNTLLLDKFEPVSVNGVLFGQSAEFNRTKRYIKFTSKFHEPGYVYYDQIKIIKVKFMKKTKRKFLWWALATLVMIVGIYLMFVRAYMPPWQIQIELKNAKKKDKPVVIQARIDMNQAQKIIKYCEPDVPVALLLNE